MKFVSENDEIIKIEKEGSRYYAVPPADTLYGRTTVRLVRAADSKTLWTGIINVTVTNAALENQELIYPAPQLEAGGDFSVALKIDGSVWTWGNNENGQLGINKTDAYVDRPTAVPSLKSVDKNYAQQESSGAHDMIMDIAAGKSHVIMLTVSSGEVISFGLNDHGQLGIDSRVLKTIAPTVAGKYTGEQGNRKDTVGNIVAVAAGDNHSLALGGDGHVYAWGANDKGQLGIGEFGSDVYYPMPVLKGDSASPDNYLNNIIAIDAGADYSMALRSDGMVYAWGDVSNGQLGTMIRSNVCTPAQVWNGEYSSDWYIENATHISAGEHHALAVTHTDDVAVSHVYGWGSNEYGQLAHDTKGNTYDTPVLIESEGMNTDTVTQVAAGNKHSVVLTKARTAYAWGNNDEGQLGVVYDEDDLAHLGLNVPESLTPIVVSAGESSSKEKTLKKALGISAGGNHTTIYRTDGTVWSWGQGALGRIGDFDTITRFSPVQTGDKLIKTLAVYSGDIYDDTGAFVKSVTKEDMPVFLNNGYKFVVSTVYEKFSAGFNLILNENISAVPFPAKDYVLTTMDTGLGKATQRADGKWEIEAVKDNRYGEVSFIIKSNDGDGVVGSDGSGNPRELDPDYSGVFKLNIKQNIEGKVVVPMIAAGTDHILALKSDGTIWSWGNNKYGQLGNGEIGSSALSTAYPAKLTIKHDNGTEVKFMAVAAGNMFSVALSTEGEVYTWGWNEYGQLGNGKWNNYVYNATGATKHVYGTCDQESELSASHEWHVHDHTVYSRTKNNYDSAVPTKISVTDDAGNNIKVVAISAATGTGDVQTVPAKNVKLNLINHPVTGAHTLALDLDGYVYGWGFNNKGQLGVGGDVEYNDVNIGYRVDTSQGEAFYEIGAGITKEYIIANPTYLNNRTLYTSGADVTYKDVHDKLIITNPTRVAGLEGIKYLTSITEIAAGGANSAAVRADGYAFTWGDNSKKQLGSGKPLENINEPVQLWSGEKSNQYNFFRDALYIDIATDHGVVSTRDGKVYAWGTNTYGQLGRGNEEATTSETPVVMVRTEDNSHRGLGEDIITTTYSTATYTTTDNTTIPAGATIVSDTVIGTDPSSGDDIHEYTYTVEEPDTTSADNFIVHVSAGASQSYATAVNGDVYGWGLNDRGQIGKDNNLNYYYAVHINAGETRDVDNSEVLTNVTRVYAGETQAMSVKYDGYVYGWGQFGETGQFFEPQLHPIFVGETPAHIYEFGDGWYMLGSENPDSTDAAKWALNQYPGSLPNITTINNNGQVQFALVTNGTDNGMINKKYLGFNLLLDVEKEPTPESEVRDIEWSSSNTNIADITVDFGTNRAIITANKERIYGETIITARNDNTGYFGMFRVQVKPEDGIVMPMVVSTSESSMGSTYTLAADGTVYGWGWSFDGVNGKETQHYNTNGTYSYSDYTRRSVPTKVTFSDSKVTDAKIKYIATGEDHLLAVDTNGYVWVVTNNTNTRSNSSARNNNLYLSGTGATYDSSRVLKGVQDYGDNDPYLKNIDIVAGGRYNSAAIDKNGIVYIWGTNDYGLMGVESAASNRASTTPKYTIKGMSAGDHPEGALIDFVDITMGENFIAALRKDGNVFTWGNNETNQLGRNVDPTIVKVSRAPQQVLRGDSENSVTTGYLRPYLRNVIDIDAGSKHTLALMDNNRIYGWGDNTSRQLAFDTANAVDPNDPTQPNKYYDTTTNSAKAPVYASVNLNYASAPAAGETEVEGETVVGITTNNNTAAAVLQSGRMYVWGDNTNYQAGQNENTNATPSVTKRDPVYVKRGNTHFYDDITPTLGWVASAAVNARSATVIRYDGSVYSWGVSNNYELGNNQTASRSVPMKTGTFEDRREVIGKATLYTTNDAGSVIDTQVYDETTELLPQKITLDNNKYLVIDKEALYDNHLTGFNVVRDEDKQTILNTRYGTQQYHQAFHSNENRYTPWTPVTRESIRDNISFVSLDTTLVNVTESADHKTVTIRPNVDHRWASTYITYHNPFTNYTNVLEVAVKDVNAKAVPMISAGGNHTLALLPNGEVWAWGSNTYGQLGNGDRSNWGGSGYNLDGPSAANARRNDVMYPVKVNIPEGVTITAVSAGKRHSLALTDDGKVYIWGYVEPKNIVWGDYMQGNIVTRRYYDNYYSSYGATDSRYYTGAWSYYEDGNAHGTDRFVYSYDRIFGLVTPTLVKISNGSNLTDVLTISAGDDTSFAVKKDGTVWAWGHNGPTGKLGLGTADTTTWSAGSITEGDTMTFTIPGHWENDEWVAASSTSLYCGNYISNHTDYLYYAFTYWNNYGKVYAQQVTGAYNMGKLNNVTSVRTGADSTYAIKSDGTVWAWGSNQYVQRNGATTVRTVPNRVLGTETTGAYSAHPLEVLNASSLSRTDTPEKYLHDIVEIQTGGVYSEYHGSSIMTTANGNTSNYGSISRSNGPNDAYDDVFTLALANPTRTDRTAGSLTYGVKTYSNDGGFLYAWGSAENGQLATGGDLEDGMYSAVPRRITTLPANTYVTGMSAGGRHASAVVHSYTNEGGTVTIDPERKVYIWGDNSKGQLGNGDDTYANSNTPVRIVRGENDYNTDEYLDEIISVSNGEYFTTAILRNGTVWTWGSNRNGQYGNNYRVNSLIPVHAGDRSADVLTIYEDRDISRQIVKRDPATGEAILDTDKKLQYDTVTEKAQLLKVTIKNGETVNLRDKIYSVAYDHVPGFEAIDYDKVGVGTIPTSALNFRLSSNTDVATLNASTGVVTANNNGIYGTTTVTFDYTRDCSVDYPTDEQFALAATNLTFKGSLVIEVIKNDTFNGDLKIAVPTVKSGRDFHAALMDNGTVWTWGANGYGQLGDGTTSRMYYPIRVKGVGGTGYLDNIVAIDTGDYHVIALDKNGEVYAWGINNYAQTGNATTTANKTTPIKVTLPEEIIFIASGTNHNVALGVSGKAYTWGYNGYGQLGNTTAGNHDMYTSTGKCVNANYTDSTADGYMYYSTPQIVRDLNNGHNVKMDYNEKNVDEYQPMHNVVQIAAGGNSTMLLRADGTAFTFGLGSSGQLGYDNSRVEAQYQLTANNRDDAVAIGATNTTYHKTLPAQVVNRGDDTVKLATRGGKDLYNMYMQNVTAMDMGSAHTILLTDNTRRAYTAGNGGSGRLASGATANRYSWSTVNTAANTPLTNVLKVGAGYDRTYVTVEGYADPASPTTEKLYVAGSNANKALDADADDETAITYAKQVTVTDNLRGGISHANDDVLSVSFGEKSTIAMLKDGTVWGWGVNENGQLGDFYNRTYSGTRQIGPLEYYTLNFKQTEEANRAATDDDELTHADIRNLGNGYIRIFDKTLIDKDGDPYDSTNYTVNTYTIDPSKINLKYVTGFNLHDDSKYVTVASKLPEGTTPSYTFSSSDDRIATVSAAGVITPVLAPANGNYGRVTITVTEQNTGYTGLIVADILKYNKMAVPMIASGHEFTVALKANGTVWTWGKNDKGQLGIGYTIVNDDDQIELLRKADSSISRVASWNDPIPVTGTTGLGKLNDIVQIAAGDYFVAALDIYGNVYTWGYNNAGQLGNGATSTTAYAYAPQRVLAGDSELYEAVTTGEGESAVTTNYLTGIVGISAGPDYMLAVDKNGHVLAWGNNSSSKLATSYRASSTTNITTPAYLTAGQMASDTEFEYQTTSVVNGQTVKSASVNSRRPTQNPQRLSNIVAVEAGHDHAFAIASNGSILAFGSNRYGQLGIATSDSYIYKEYNDGNEASNATAEDKASSYSYVPLLVQRGAKEENTLATKAYGSEFMYGAVEAVAGDIDTFIRTTDYTVYTSGINGTKTYNNVTYNTNQLLGVTGLALKKFEVKDGDDTLLDKIYQISSNGNSTSVIGSKGTQSNIIYTVGNNQYGQLGRNKAAVSDASNVVSDKIERVFSSEKRTDEVIEYFDDAFIADYGNNHLTMMKRDGTVYTVGLNSSGQLGDLSYNDSPIPVKVGPPEVDTLEMKQVEIKEGETVKESYVSPDYLDIVEGQKVDFNKNDIWNKRLARS